LIIFKIFNKCEDVRPMDRKSMTIVTKNSLTTVSRITAPRPSADERNATTKNNDTNVLVIDSNDAFNDDPDVNNNRDSHDDNDDIISEVEATLKPNRSNSRLFPAADSIEVFTNKPKIQRTPDTKNNANRKTSLTGASNSSSSSFMPKYSVAEPRPSSSSSSNNNKSRNSPTTSNQETDFTNNNNNASQFFVKKK
jgi:hypothetical protein